MSRTYRRRSDPIPWWVQNDYTFDISITKLIVRAPIKGKRLKKEIAKWRSDSGWHGNYAACPGWWNHLYHEVPMRRQTKKALKQTKELLDYEDTPEFPLFKKPHIYYW